MTITQRATIHAVNLLLLFTVTLVSGVTEAGELLHDSEVKGDLVVATGCEAPALLAGLKANDRYRH